MIHSRNHTVFVVEDERVSRTTIIAMLKGMRINNIVASTNGQIAFEKMQNQSPDLIISDWQMPDMNGLDLYKAIQKEESLKNIPFIMVTVEDQKERVIEAMTIGIRHYIVKPLSKVKFENKVKELLKI